MTKVWSAVSPDLFQLKEWEGEGVLYLADSGDTHLLNQVGVQVLMILKDKPFELSELVEQLNQSIYPNSERITDNMISGVLTELYYLGVLTKVKS